jgi:hypothetical protein
MTAITSTWICRITAGAALAAAPGLIALGTATASYAQTGSNSTSPSYAPAPSTQTGQYPWHNQPWNNSSFHHRHAAGQQSQY